MDNNNKLVKYSNSNKFDKDIIKEPSNNINQSSSNNINTDYFNEYDEDNNLNLNININNYLSKNNINSNIDVPNSYSMSSRESQMTKSKILLKKHNTNNYLKSNLTKKLNNSNVYNKRKLDDNLKSKLLTRIQQQKPALNDYDFKNNNMKQTNKEILLSQNMNDKNNKREKSNKNEKEDFSNVPKILTFLRTFKNLALPMKINNDKQDNENYSNTQNDLNSNSGGVSNGFAINPNNSCFNFNSKLKPKIEKLNLNQRNNNMNANNKFITDENMILKDNNNLYEVDDLIDYNRFTFRNNNGNNENSAFKTLNQIRNKNENKKAFNSVEHNLYEYNDKNDFDNDMNINIDEYNQKYNKYNNNQKNRANIKKRYMRKIQTKNDDINSNLKINEISPKFNQRNNIANNYFNNKYNDNAYTKISLKKNYDSPQPEPKKKTNNNNSIYSYNNLSNNMKIPSFDSNNKSEDSFQSLNISKRYRKPIIINNFRKLNNKNNGVNSYYNNNDISADEINLNNNRYSSKRPFKNNKIHEIKININDSLDSYNKEPNYYTNNNLDSKKSPLKRKNNSYYINSSPFTSNKLNDEDLDSDNIDTSRIDEDENNLNKNKSSNNTIFSRFMKPFQRNEYKKWYNEDSYFSFDIVNMNKISRDKNLLYQKPLGTRPRHMNKNNSMYINKGNLYNKKGIHKTFFYENNPNNITDINKYRNKNDYTDYDEKENNVYDFDAPKAIKDYSIDDSNNTEIVNDSARENQFSMNSDINTNKLNDSINNNNLESDNSNSNNSNKNKQSLSKKISKKMVYMKKLNTVYNFYQGTKKLFSNINNKVFKLNKKDDKKVNNNKTENNSILKKKAQYKSNENNFIKKNDLLIYQGEITPRGREDNEENNTSFYTKNSMGTPIVKDNKKIQKNHSFIKIKIKNQKSHFSKYYSYYLPKINHNIVCCYLSKAFNTNKCMKIPKTSMYYMSKQNLKVCKLPIQNKKCYFQKHYIVKTINKCHQKFVSFFSIGDNFIINNDSDSPLKNNKKENINNNYKIVNLKNNIFSKDAQINLILSNDFKENENVDIHYGNSFSFKDNKNIINSNNINNNYISNDFIEINNFNFSLTPKTILQFNDYQKIKPQKKENMMIINCNKNKNVKYEYKYILSLKDNEYCINNNLLSKEVIEHFDNINKEADIIKLPFKNNDNNDENKNNIKIPPKKIKKEEIQNLINNNLTPSKSESIKVIFNKNFLTEKNERKCSNFRDNIDNDDMENGNSDVKLKLEWVRNDLSKEIEQAEKYIQELKKKMEENTKRNDIIGLLNMLTVDNMNNILNKILVLVLKNKEEEQLLDKDIVCNEYILIKIIVDKAITEKRFVNLYAKLSFELFQKLNDIIYNNINFKKILMEECKMKFNELNDIKVGESDDINIDDEKNYLIKIKFLGNIDLICELINVNILNHDVGFYYLKELFNKYYYINNNTDVLKEIEKFKKYLCLEAIVNFLSKFGKKIYESKNINSFKCLNYFIDNDLNSILKSENLPGFIKYKIINLIEKQKNKWEDSLFEKSILAKGKDNNKNFNRGKKNSISLSKPHRIRKRRHSNKSLMSPDNYISNKISPENDNYNANNTYKNNTKRDKINYLTPLFDKLNINMNNNNDDIIKLIEKDIEKYEMFLKNNYITNEEELNQNSEIGNEFDWSMIEGILTKNNKDLGEIIRCYIEVCIDHITNNTKMFIANDYIKNIIYYYSTNLTSKEKDIIHNKMITIFINIQDICIDNFIMKEIMGYLIFILIENKIYYIKDLNNFINLDKEIIITIAEVIKYAIISSGLKCKKYHNDFKQTKLFVDNSIFNEYVTSKIKEHLN